MVVTVESVSLTLHSKPYKSRAGLLPMLIALGIGFFFSCMWFGVAAWMLVQNGREFLIWGTMIVLSTLGYCAYLAVAGYKIYADSRRQYSLELTASDAVLSVTDHLRKKQSTQMVLIADVKYVEHYPYQDCASLILHAPYADMEVPLWPFGAQGQDVIDFLEGRGVHVINIQSDEKIPD